MTKNFAEQLEYIKKYARTPPPPPGGSTAQPQRRPPPPAPGGSTAPPARTPPASGAGSSYVGYAAPLNPVKQMQEAIKEFAQAVTSYSSQPKKPTQPGGTTPQPTTKEPSGRKAFNDFITEQYLATSDVKGVEWDPDPSRVTQQQKKQRETDLIEMDIVVNTLQRIGKPKSELNADGIWDFRTNNALLNVYAFATALVQLYKDFQKTPPNIFGNAQLQVLYKNIVKPDDAQGGDPKKLSAQDKTARANALIPALHKLTEFYQSYVKRIATNPWYKQYIDGAPMFKIQPAKADPAKKTSQEEQALKYSDRLPLINVVVTNKAGTQQVIGNFPLSSLTSVKNLKNSLIGLGGLNYTANEITPEVLKRVISELSAHVDQKLTTIAPKAPPMQIANSPQIATEPSKQPAPQTAQQQPPQPQQQRTAPPAVSSVPSAPTK